MAQIQNKFFFHISADLAITTAAKKFQTQKKLP